MPGQPQSGTNGFIGIDATAVDITDPSGESKFVIPAGTAFQIAATWALDGSFAPFLVALPINYTVSYAFSGIGVPDGPAQSKGPQPTVAGQLTYDAKDAAGNPETEVTVPGTALSPGLYQTTAVVSFGGAPPMSAFVTGPVLEIF
jgi:hypothetical protein